MFMCFICNLLTTLYQLSFLKWYCPLSVENIVVVNYKYMGEILQTSVKFGGRVRCCVNNHENIFNKGIKAQAWVKSTLPCYAKQLWLYYIADGIYTKLQRIYKISSKLNNILGEERNVKKTEERCHL